MDHECVRIYLEGIAAWVGLFANRVLLGLIIGRNGARGIII